MEAIAKMKSIPLSARKMRYVIDSIRGKSVDEAFNILKFSKREASEWAEKLLLSAVANWENKLGNVYSADDYDLYVKTAFADDGGSLKRFRPVPHGRAHRIRKRMNHLTLVVANNTAVEADETEEIDNENTED
ncbi:MAG: 50S ribosomal protein L22 [Saprospiraceae bacterium]|nr:50S ribosomal protein L22 [Bacteroidia bacterium]NNE16043.1 50S ribosomal protein L22 [Saprospiraceae bacterium]NNL90737.1 50S ribosomal protein L22 [Saprospiraceae bacterium]